MGRLIDADALKEYITKAYEEMKSEFKTDKYRDMAKLITESFCMDIDEAPTVDAESLITQHEDIGYERGYRDGYAEALEVTDDAEPVKHGHWYDDPNYMGTGKTMYFCSYCGSASYREDPYCWHCGSKMDVPDTDVGKMEVEE